VSARKISALIKKPGSQSVSEIKSSNSSAEIKDNFGAYVNRLKFFGSDRVAGAPGAGIQVAMIGRPFDRFEIGGSTGKNSVSPDILQGRSLNPTQGGTAPRFGYETLGSPVHSLEIYESEAVIEVVPREWNWDLFRDSFTPNPGQTTYHNAKFSIKIVMLTDTIMQHTATVVAPAEGHWLIEMPAVFTWSDRSTRLWHDKLGNGKDIEQIPMPGFQEQVPFDMESDSPKGIFFSNGDDYAVGVYAKPGDGIAALRAWGDTSNGTNTKKLEASSGAFDGRTATGNAFILFGKHNDIPAAASTLFGNWKKS